MKIEIKKDGTTFTGKSKKIVDLIKVGKDDRLIITVPDARNLEDLENEICLFKSGKAQYLVMESTFKVFVIEADDVVL